MDQSVRKEKKLNFEKILFKHNFLKNKKYILSEKIDDSVLQYINMELLESFKVLLFEKKNVEFSFF